MEEQASSFIKTTVEEIERLLSARAVIGEPVTTEGTTIIPLLSMGFFFGVASASAKGEVKQKTESSAGGGGVGTGAAGGIKPVAVVIIDKGNVRIEPLTMMAGLSGLAATTIEKTGETVQKVAEAIPRMVRRGGEQKKESA